ncbi:MAG: hypothetical protein ACI9FN_003268 [Saprospiraceae bacterium]|jgi:hypothetical protein
MGCPSSLEELLETPLTEADIASGLKESLNLGTGEAVDFLSTKDGFYKSLYKIYLPEEARQVTDKLKFIPGFSNVEEVILEKINRAAEDAAKNVGPIFLNSIKQMSITDALGILMGEKNAATSYLNQTTYKTLYDQFQPVVLQSLNKFNAVDYWADALEKYNKIPLLGDVNPRLDDYVVGEALKGLFSLIEEKELGIRTDIDQRISPLLQRVFKKQDGQ